MNINKDQIIERFENESKKLSADDKKNLLREILQETILCHMKAVGLFNDMAFHGGTSLRLLYRIDRFSEDLDMSLITANNAYDLPDKMKALKSSLSKSKIDLEFQNKCKAKNEIKVFYINDSALLAQFAPVIENVNPEEKIKIKLELDINPPNHQEFVELKIKSPFSALIKAHTIETCMGQKIHAILCRGAAYGMDIVKGRDIYDFEWYVLNKKTPNLKNLSACLNRIGPWKSQSLDVDIAWIRSAITACLESKKFKTILSDVRPLLSAEEYSRIEPLWKLDYFSGLLSKL